MGLPPGLNPAKFDSSRFERTTYACCRIVIKTSGIAFIQGGKVFISVVSDVSNNSGRPLRKNKNVLEISSNTYHETGKQIQCCIN